MWTLVFIFKIIMVKIISEKNNKKQIFTFFDKKHLKIVVIGERFLFFGSVGVFQQSDLFDGTKLQNWNHYFVSFCF